MNRRGFGRALLGLTGAALVRPESALSALSAGRRPRTVNGERLMEQIFALAEFGRNPEGGVSRVAYSEADREGRAYVRGLMRAAELDFSVDAAGNLIGRRDGTGAGLAPIALGSHIDSVPMGGNYDGPVGSLGAIEVARTLAEHGLAMRHPIEVIIFQNEEGGKTGSRVLDGEFRERELDLVTASGRTIRDGIAIIGGDPSRLSSVRRAQGDLAAFLELHIEQGAVLESSATQIGVVEGIVGIKRWRVTVDGIANHAGTTPMDQRHDAMLAAAGFVKAVNEVVRAVPGPQVATVGRLEASPGAPNVIAGQVVATLEIRDLHLDRIDAFLEAIQARSDGIGRETGTHFAFDEIYRSLPALTEPYIQEVISGSAAELGLSTRSMPSGAGHDAQSMARIAPIGMIFVPSVGGVSHSPHELTHPRDVVNGVNVLLHTLLTLDQTLPA
jgi:N-carbamoyl-L-amino-acid hydrolase